VEAIDLNEPLFALLPFVAIAALATWFAVMFRRRAWQHGALDRGRGSLVEPGLATPPRDARPYARPWWGNPWLWVAISGIFLVLGVFVWPGLFGGIFVFLPFVWVSRPRPPAMDPRGNGHDARDRGGAAPL
jgi:hypothetical protein